jgi:ArsR family transcriptional regulator, lead/cadmium/zinc/bismuth-responsive transcriptional repressor
VTYGDLERDLFSTVGDVTMVNEAVAERLSATFRVLSDPTRVRIISALTDQPLCVHELAGALEMTHSAISHQLALLRELRLVVAKKEGRHVIYRLDDVHIVDLFEQGLAHIAHT